MFLIFSIKMKAVINKSFSEVKTTEVIVAKFKEKRETQKVLKFLKTTCPDLMLPHLKVMNKM